LHCLAHRSVDVTELVLRHALIKNLLYGFTKVNFVLSLQQHAFELVRLDDHRELTTQEESSHHFGLIFR
jgi:hypothetical protein